MRGQYRFVERAVWLGGSCYDPRYRTEPHSPRIYIYIDWSHFGVKAERQKAIFDTCSSWICRGSPSPKTSKSSSSI